MSDVNLKTKTTRVENETSKKQADDLKKAKAKIEEQNKKVVETREKNKQELEAKKQAQAKAQEEKVNSNSNESVKQVAEFASKALSCKKQKGFFSGLLTGLLIGLVAGVFVSSTLLGSISDKVETSKETTDAIIDETFLGYTAADFKNAILGECVEKQDLIVMEQYLTTEVTITKAGLGNLEIFSKVKNVNFAGKGIYTVDLSKLGEDNIKVDEENKTVTILIPHTVLHDIVADFDNTTFEDTQKGLLAFGDLALTMEDQNEIEKSVQTSMKDELSKKELFNKADEIALTKIWEIFNPLVVAISDEYITNIDWQ